MKSKIIILMLALILGTFTSCEKFLDINKDPNNPTDATIVNLLPTAQIGVAFAFSNVPCRVSEDAVQHLVIGRYDGWAVDGSDLSNEWRFSLYAGALKDIEDIIDKGVASDNYYYVGIAKLLKAYSYSLMVDIWDDIPYSQACSTYEYPEFDDAAAIYDNIFLLIDDAILDLGKENSVSLQGVDLIYNGDVAAWIRMGNTLKLKLYNQIRLVDPNKAKLGIEALVADEANHPGEVLITSEDQDFKFKYVNNANPENRHPGFQSDYMVKGESYISNYFYNLLTGLNDPRVPYYFYLQDGTFSGRDYGDPAPIANDGDTRSVQGIYPVGGKYDDGSAQTVSGSSASGAGELRMITNFMRLYIEAEAALTLNAAVSGTAEELFESAVRASFQEVNLLDAPDIPEFDIEDYIQNRLIDYNDSTTTESKLDLIIQQKWIALFGNGLEAYNDYRRTGFPLIPPPIQTNELPLLRFPYPNDELDANSNAPAQPNRNVPVFWDIN
ncbi:MAG: SusD/RagB family nutrient-binding outer membrane lipoprotein [Bacteroidales bacterium]|nr:SusD/RagB family nutrient-binding outer membrane lipoprotein [Bacteroidales bacterium]